MNTRAIRKICLSAIVFLTALSAVPAKAEIVFTGNHDPVTYIGSGNWTVGTDLSIGDSSDGSIAISNGFTASNTAGYIGFFSNITGTATITGAGSTWTNSGNLSVGYNGDGILNIEAGSAVSNAIGYMGYFSGSTGTVTASGIGSTWTNSGNLIVGFHGDGILNIESGSAVSNTEGSIGHSSGSIGIATITGAGSSWTSSAGLYIGGTDSASGGTGVLNIDDSAVVNFIGDSIVWGTGTVNISGGANNTGTFNIDIGDTLTVKSGGAFNLNSGGLLNLNGGFVFEDNALTTSGTTTGNGTLTLNSGSGTLTSGGTVAPGNSIGTLTINGNYVQQAGSTYEVEYSNTEADKIIITGAATIEDGAIIKPIPLETITNDFSYEIMTAAGGFTYDAAGSSKFVEDTALVDYDMAFDYGANSIIMSVILLDVVAAANSDNLPIARALDNIFDSNGLSDIKGELQTLDNAGLNKALEQMSGRKSVHPAGVVNKISTAYLSIVSGRIRTLDDSHPREAFINSGSRRIQLASANITGPSDSVIDAGGSRGLFSIGNGSGLFDDSQWRLWGNSYGLFGERKARLISNEYSYKAYSSSFGLDYQLSQELLTGLSLSHSQSEIDYTGEDTTEAKTIHAGLYSTYNTPDWYTDGIVFFADHNFESTRHVNFGALNQELKADFGGYRIGSYLEAGLNYQWRNMLIQPLCGFEFSYFKQDGYTEEGGSSALKHDAQSSVSYKSSLGFKFSNNFYERLEKKMFFELRARWTHEFGDTRSSTTASFIGAPGYTFKVRGEPSSRDSAVIGTGLSVSLQENLDVYTNYDLTVKSDDTSHLISGGLKYRW